MLEIFGRETLRQVKLVSPGFFHNNFPLLKDKNQALASIIWITIHLTFDYANICIEELILEVTILKLMNMPIKCIFHNKVKIK